MAEVKAVKIKACGSPKSSERCERTGVVEQLAAKRVLWIWPGGCAEPVGTARPVLLSTARRAAQHTRLPLTRWSSAVSRNLKHFLRRRRSKSTWKWDRGACFVMGPAFSSLPQPVRRWCIRYAKHKHSALLLYRRFTSRGTADVVAPLVASWMENPGIWTLLFFFRSFHCFPVGSLQRQTKRLLIEPDCWASAPGGWLLHRGRGCYWDWGVYMYIYRTWGSASFCLALLIFVFVLFLKDPGGNAIQGFSMQSVLAWRNNE